MKEVTLYRKGIYKLETIEGSKGKVQLLGSGSILRHVREAAQILAKDYGVGSNPRRSLSPGSALLHARDAG